MDASLTPPQPVHRQDYRAPDWLVPDISLSFELDPACTRVAAVLSVTRNGDHDRPLRLDGGELHPLKVAVDGRVLGADEWRRSEEHTSELQSLMRISYAVFCLTKKTDPKTRPHLYKKPQ